MKILSVTDPSFQNYGQILPGYDVAELLATLDKVSPLPEGVEYVPEQPELMALPIAKELADNAYGGMPIQIGWCNGHLQRRRGRRLQGDRRPAEGHERRQA